MQKTIITLNKESYGEGKSAKHRELRKLKKKKNFFFLKNKTKQKKNPKDMMAETHRLSPNPTCCLES